MNKRIGDWKGKVQGKCYRLWQTEDDRFEIEQVWGAGTCGVFWESETTGIAGYNEAKRYLQSIRAERI